MTIKELKENPVKLIAEDWALVSAGTPESWNTMTVSWGGVGELWGRDVVFIFIRPQRYTYEFLEKDDIFTISFYDESYRKALSLCGSKSGRDINKPAETGLTPAFTEEGAPYFEQARLVLVCKKLYAQDLGDEFVTERGAVKGFYGTDDWHRMYVSEIIGVLKK